MVVFVNVVVHFSVCGSVWYCMVVCAVVCGSALYICVVVCGSV